MDRRLIEQLADANMAVVAKLVTPLVESVESLSKRVESLKAYVSELEAKAPVSGPAGKDGVDGKDADLALIERLVLERVSALPAAKDGRDGVDGKDADLELIKKLVSSAVAELPAPRDGKDGVDGKDADPEKIKQMISEAAAELPKPQDGKDGKDGQDGKEGKEGPEGKQGAQGIAGEPGKQGRDGGPGPQGQDGKDADPELVKQFVTEAVAAVPKPQDGKDGKDAEPITQEQVVEAIMSMPDVFNGAVVKHLTANPPPAGPPGGKGDKGDSGGKGDTGRDGRDASDLALLKTFIAEEVSRGIVEAFKSIEVVDGGRDWTIKASEADINLPKPTVADFYASIWQADAEYRKGQLVTWDGSIFVALEGSVGEKPTTSKAFWQCAVKRGQHGRSAYDIALREGFKGSEKDWLASLRGDRGEQGQKGDAGPRGFNA